jgi:hypothetical protein
LVDSLAVLLLEFEKYVLLLFEVYVFPYLPILLIVLAGVGLASWLGGRRRINGQRWALREELLQNIEQGQAILDFVNAQGKGAPYDIPIPRFHKAAYEQLRNSGNLRFLKRGVREQLVTVYSAIERVEQASNRQEELLLGVAAISPLAVEIRVQNLALIRDTVSNNILTRLEQFRTFARL